MRNIGRRSLLISVVLLGAVFAIHGIAPGAAQTETQLFRGFNEIVWSEGSVEVADGLASIGGRYTAVFRWNNAGQRWDTFAPQLPSTLQGFSQLERGRVYWIAMTESGTLVPGREVDPAPGAVSTFGDGTFVVGADIRPGRYRAVDLGAFCSWVASQWLQRRVRRHHRDRDSHKVPVRSSTFGRPMSASSHRGAGLGAVTSLRSRRAPPPRSATAPTSSASTSLQEPGERPEESSVRGSVWPASPGTSASSSPSISSRGPPSSASRRRISASRPQVVAAGTRG